jgi:hypothetical protein
MDEVISCGAMQREIRTFNNLRVYFKVTCLLEICNAGGNKIATQYAVFPKDAFNHRHMMKIIWPYQERPGRKSFQMWLKVLHLTFE